MLLIANSVNVSNVPEEIRILPCGTVESQKGVFKVDSESIDRIITRFKQRNIDLVIDYEHQTLNNVQAPAAGWIKALYLKDNALVAKVEWTERAKEYLTGKEYKYLSPVVNIRNSDRKAVGLHSVALTNTPAIDNMFPIIVNSLAAGDGTETLEQEPGMMPAYEKLLSELCSMLNLPEDSDEEKVKKAVQDLMRENKKTSSELKELRYDLFEDEVDEVISHALTTGKITAYMKDQARDMARKDLTAFRDWIKSSPQIVPIGKMALKDSERTHSEPNSRINALLGLSSEEFQKYNH
ncbi:MAG: hypothetical protein HFI20_06440 [Lachnospiraceae bacterium]|nr:hypothetical protein [Lachnospiraceae bacterium]